MGKRNWSKEPGQRVGRGDEISHLFPDGDDGERKCQNQFTGILHSASKWAKSRCLTRQKRNLEKIS